MTLITKPLKIYLQPSDLDHGRGILSTIGLSVRCWQMLDHLVEGTRQEQQVFPLLPGQLDLLNCDLFICGGGPKAGDATLYPSPTRLAVHITAACHVYNIPIIYVINVIQLQPLSE